MILAYRICLDVSMYVSIYVWNAVLFITYLAEYWDA